jgi:hypothetical protein
MPKTKISEFSSTPANNTDIDSINIAEGCAPSGINDAIRELMAQLKDFQAGTAGDPFNGATAGAHNGTVGATTPAAGTFTTLESTGNTTLGDAAADTVTVNGTANFVAAPTIGGVGLGMGFKNRIINGAMVIDQRGATATATLAYAPDRFRILKDTAAGTFTLAQSSVAPTGFNKSALFTVGTAFTPSASENNFYQHAIEGFNTADFGFGTAAASTVTLSFWVRASITGTYGGVLQNESRNRSYPFTYVVNAANTWEQKTITIAGDTSGTWVGAANGVGLFVIWGLGVGSNGLGTPGAWAGSLLISATGAVQITPTAGATWAITGVQLEKGSTATSFDYRPYGTELALCQRYLPCFNTTGTTGFEIGVGFYATTTIARITVAFPVETRVSPTGVTAVNPANFTANGNANSIPSAIAYGGAGTKSGVLDVTIPLTAIVAGYGVHLFGNASGTGQIQFTGCEL